MAYQTFCSIPILPSENSVFSFVSFTSLHLISRIHRKPVTRISAAYRRVRRKRSKNDMSFSVPMSSPPDSGELDDDTPFNSNPGKTPFLRNSYHNYLIYSLNFTLESL